MINTKLVELLPENDPQNSTIINEAKFGYEYVKPIMQRLPKNARVLEVGSGPCVLLSQLAIDYPDAEITGIEPVGPGFDNFKPTLKKLIERFNLNLFEGMYEDFESAHGFDLIFSINVFEHLPDWRDYLGFIERNLTERGEALILCPNYGFPYESHFKLPIIVNKNLTGRIFRNRINSFEQEHTNHGLWDSLNFVKWSAVRQEIAGTQLDVTFDATITRRMIERLDSDPAFSKRQEGLTKVAKWVLNSGLMNVLESPRFHRFNPYMLLRLRRKPAATPTSRD